MVISAPDGPGGILWQGALLPPAAIHEPAQVTACLAKPQQWPLTALMPPQSARPAGGRHLYLLRFVFTLEPAGTAAPVAAEFSAMLKVENDRAGLFFDAFPREQFSHIALPVALRIAPGFKLAPVEPGQAGGEFAINYGKVPPIIHLEGVGSAHLTWQFQVHPRQPLHGERVLLAVVSLPPDLPAVTVQLNLTVTLRDALGQFYYLSLPERLTWRAGEAQPAG